ncbi:hypothetical protein LTR62_008517 [Meristemomyces frigidus]|uniref:Nonribosomal peptide synthetase 12 n=1 Tax=Meristemomyces frigidus TaxID=1508187 RepID=A0AAN7TUD4_9PEZI|nr:hypothetical protein LTR62_008517 [Meristemomyces frigidus]
MASKIVPEEAETCHHTHDGHSWSRCWRQTDHVQYEASNRESTPSIPTICTAQVAEGSATPFVAATDLYKDGLLKLGQGVGSIAVPLSDAEGSPDNTSDAGSRFTELKSDLELPRRAYITTEKISSTTLCSSDITEISSARANLKPRAVAKDILSHIATKIQLLALQNVYPLRPIDGNSTLKEARYKVLSFYRRVMVTVLLTNMLVLAVMIPRSSSRTRRFGYEQAATAVGANLLTAVLMRQEHAINLLFHMACSLPARTPLKIRRIAAKMAYNNGGVHSGSAVSALLWYIFYAVLVVRHFRGGDAANRAVAAISAAILVIFTMLILLAHPTMRRKYHDLWELSHRFGGWTAVALVWAQIMTVAVTSSHPAGRPLAAALVSLPTFWFLVIITCCLVYPWLRLKRLPVNATKLSDHATQLHFADRQLPTCRAVRLAHNPLLECHGFATIPDKPDTSDAEKGYTVVISRAGDFTHSMIQHPPKHIWLRGAPTTGVMRLSSLFTPIVIVATGSGIGPCLSFLNVYPNHPMRILWSARSPAQTYQADIMNDVLRADGNAVIIDTKRTGKPDLIALTFALAKECAAEAVMIISNPAVTREVVYGMESRGIAAFGAIFDS